MANGRGDRGARGSEGSDDYDWLYSKGDAKASSAGNDESTQVIRTGPGAAGAGGGSGPGASRPRSTGSDRPPPARIAPTPTDGAPPSEARPSRSSTGGRRFKARWLLLLVLAWVVYMIAVPVYAWTTVSTVKTDPGEDRPADQPGTTYLVVGSDARPGLEGRRTDTIMLLHTGDGPNLLLSIPRDSLVEIPGEGTNKINAAFAFGGPDLLVQTVEGATGIRIDHYVEMGFRGLVKLVDAVGGIEICPKDAIDDPEAKIDIPAGCQEADGATALGYARSRKSQELGDIDRAKNQREVVSAIGSEVLSWQTFVNPVRYYRVVTAGASSVRVGEDTGPIAAGRFAFGMTRVNGENGLTCGVPIADLAVNWDPERAPQLFELIAADKTDEVTQDLCRPTGIPDS